MNYPWTRITSAAAAPVAVVAVIAGVVSYSHIEALGLMTGQSLADSRQLPFAVDGLIVAGSVILLAGSRLGWIGVALGVGGTLYANVMSGLPRGPLAATVAAWPALAFTAASFMLERWLAAHRDARESVPAVAVEIVPVDFTEPGLTGSTPPATEPVAVEPAVEPVVGAVAGAVVDATPPPAPLPAEVVTEAPTEPGPPAIPKPRKRLTPATASDEQLADLILEHCDDPAALNPYRAGVILKEQCGGKKVGDARARRLVELVQRKHRGRTVRAIGERR